MTFNQLTWGALCCAVTGLPTTAKEQDTIGQTEKSGPPRVALMLIWSNGLIWGGERLVAGWFGFLFLKPPAENQQILSTATAPATHTPGRTDWLTDELRNLHSKTQNPFIHQHCSTFHMLCVIKNRIILPGGGNGFRGMPLSFFLSFFTPLGFNHFITYVTGFSYAGACNGCSVQCFRPNSSSCWSVNQQFSLCCSGCRCKCDMISGIVSLIRCRHTSLLTLYKRCKLIKRDTNVWCIVVKGKHV